MVLLSYIGGKARVSKKIIEHIPPGVKLIVSPFFGAGSVEFLGAYQGYIVKGFDIFPELVNFWQQLKKNPGRFVQEVEQLLPMTKSRYMHFRTQLSPQLLTIKQAVMFFVVNKCSYNGIMSGSYSNVLGKLFTNTPKRLRKFKYPAHLSVQQQDFVKTLEDFPNDFLFLDPPYYEVMKTYGLKAEYSVINHELLARLLCKRKAPWLLVYNDHPWVRKRYSKCYMSPLVSRYNSNQTGRQLLITNYPQR